jgi:site-specific DNA-methyltransferase (adenine-specific)
VTATWGEHEIVRGDVLEVLRTLPDDSFDAVLSDPPYGLKFMAKAWDYDVPSVEVWRECLRVLKPGGLLLSFGGSRTYHRIATAIEDAGFELRDQLLWLYAKGFPKSFNISKALDKSAGAERKVIGKRKLTGNAAVSTKDKGGTYGVQVGSAPAKEVDVTAPATPEAIQWHGYGTALKPAFEPICLARKPLEGTIIENVRKWGTGGLAIGACRIGDEGGTKKRPAKEGTTDSKCAYSDGLNGGGPEPIDEGRWPANVLFDEGAAEYLDEVVGNRPSRKSVTRNGGGNAGGAVFDKRVPGQAKPDSGRNENGGPSRFFFCAKVSTKEREFGCEELVQKSAGEATGGRREGSDGLNSPRAGAGRTSGARNHHPTLKPIALNEYLAKLIKPPTADATLLVPYSGAGSEMIGALRAGWPNVLGIERDLDDEGQVAGYIEIAEARIAAWMWDAYVCAAEAKVKEAA